ncbi:Agglutination protein [Cyclobacterium qasimii M12-11B]|uniref:Agglutination protein n=3 Tax=Cyclobacterium qasimii TaxID=1350429 RepID=S7VLL6_9BACT|nr:Agglutination protein [Cyclobacterium qasimii M12-11B]GEO21625.1 membrane protein [Cyclobacterium qasimii]
MHKIMSLQRKNSVLKHHGLQLFALTAMLVFTASSTVVNGQEMLSREEAMGLTLNHNYDIKVAEKSLEVADNNQSILNTGFLPTVFANGNAGISGYQGQNQTVNGDINYDPTDAYNYSASVGVDYVLFNGYGRMYNYKQLKELYNISELQARQIIENTLLELSNSYFLTAQLTESVSILKNALSISTTRMLRAQYSFEYGQTTQIDLLNAQVDVNNDSINLLNTIQDLENSRRNLNLIMGREIEMEFAVDTTINFAMPGTKEDLIDQAYNRNVLIQQTNSQLRNSEFALKASQAGWFPALSLNAGYNYSGNQNPAGAFVTGSYNLGPQAGLSLAWNVFDGGSTRIKSQNARLEIKRQQILKEETEFSVKRDVLNAYGSYQNSLFVYYAEKANLETATKNFERSDDLYKQGQINSIEFRQAQLNLLNAQNNQSIAKYNAKYEELKLKQLAGILLED